MENQSVRRITAALGLERQIVGVKLIAYRQEFEACPAPAMEGRLSFCGMVNKASRGAALKARDVNFGCAGGGRALGILETNEMSRSGRHYRESGLYASYAVARNVNEHMVYIPYRHYGVMVAPLAEMEEADTVIILANARQVMRIMQGYAHQFGAPEHLSAFGTQAMCADLVSKPFMNNDINISLMCRGARLFAQCDDGELGVGLPIQMLERLTVGIVSTMNVVESNQVKKEIQARLRDPEELGVPVVMDMNYPANLERYRLYCEKMERDGEE